MTGGRRRDVRLCALTLAVTAAVTSCGSRSLVVLEVTGDPDLPLVQTVRVEARNVVQLFSSDIPRSGQTPLVVGIYLPDSVEGSVSVTVSGLDAAACAVGTGRIEVPVEAGASLRRMVHVRRDTAATCQGGPGPRVLLTGTTDPEGIGRVGTGMGAIQLLVLDVETNRPIPGADLEAMEGADGYVVRVSKEREAYEPELVYAPRSVGGTVVMRAATPDLRVRSMLASHRVLDSEWVKEADFDGVAAQAAQVGATNILFIPAPTEGASARGEKFHIYQTPMSRTLIAVRQELRPASGAMVAGKAKAIGVAGAARAQLQVGGKRLSASAETKMTDMNRRSPALTGLTPPPPGMTGDGNLGWEVDDPDGQLIGFDVGIDSTTPGKRVGKDVRNLLVNVKRGSHFACVRPVFDGSDAEPQLRCAAFAAPMAPAAPELKVAVRTLDEAKRKAKMPFPIEVDVENSGDVAVSGFEVMVVISRDGRVEGGEGEVRNIKVDGLAGRTKVTRKLDVRSPKDGAFFVVAEADRVRKLLGESNPEDNRGRKAFLSDPAGLNRAPVLSLTGQAAGSGAGAVTKGQMVVLEAAADDPEEGDLSQEITWRSSRDGVLGLGAKLVVGTLSPGLHRIRAEVKDRGVTPVLVPGSPGSDVSHQGNGASHAAAAEAPEEGSAEFELEVIDMTMPVNSPPTASAGPDRTGTAGLPLALEGTALDADGETLMVSWTMVAPTNSKAALGGAATLTPTLTPDLPGDYRLTLTVRDGAGDARDDVIVTVLSPASNRAPVVALSLPPMEIAGKPVTAFAMATDPDMDPVTISYDLVRPPGSMTLLSMADTTTPTFVGDVPGPYTLTLFAEDGRGGRAMVSASVNVMGGGAPDAGVGIDGAADGPGSGIGGPCTTTANCSSGICCGGTCVDPTTNFSHCGTCGNQCPGGTFCIAATCRLPIDAPVDAPDAGADAAAPVLVSITVTPAAPSIPINGSQQFTATGNYSDSSTANLSMSVSWASSNTAIATIDALGRAMPRAAGAVTISATQGTVQGTSMLTVSGTCMPGPEMCDGVDNNCDAVTDEGYPVGAACDNGAPGPCRFVGTMVCNAPGTGTICNAPPPPAEICNNLDDNCNASIDEGTGGTTCGSDVGECISGVTSCSAGTLVCVGSAGPQSEICDAKDNDCDGVTDNACGGTKPQGDTCAMAVECMSGACVDGFCCNGTCPGLCHGCSAGRTGSPNGTCAAISSGIDPDNECAIDPPSTCGRMGMCDGGGGCALWAAGTGCTSASCTGSSYTPGQNCDGFGTCASAGMVSCAPYICGATSCKTSCVSTADCLPGSTCSGSMCVPPKPMGATCSTPAECSSSFCEDGVCCNGPCGGPCIACNRAGMMGMCSPHPPGSDPEASCGPYNCDGAGPMCPMSCNNDSQCKPMTFCTNNSGGMCMMKRGPGMPCMPDPIDPSGNHQCMSNMCNAGMCL